MPVIQIENLKKNYGKHVGTKDVTFSVEQGEIFGFVGPNGAGKSTTLKALMGFILPSGGTASIRGLDVVRESKKIKSFTGYVPSDVRLYPDMRVGRVGAAAALPMRPSGILCGITAAWLRYRQKDLLV